MREIPIVLIGHKDHGKSTLIGRLLLDAGSIKQSRIEEIKEVDRASGQKFELAHLLDSFREEREREMTMDTTRALLKGRKRDYQLIDVPGHAELISQMLTGTSGAEAALLVVSVVEGAKEQTRQHLEIARLLGIEQLGVVINKMDAISYKKGPFDELVKSLRETLNKVGYASQNIHFFPISALEGDNVIKKSKNTPWYQASTLLDFLENEIRPPESFKDLPLRFLVQDKYQEGKRQILVGKIESGKLEVGQDILFLPNKKQNKIEVVRDSEKKLHEAFAGENVGISLDSKSEINRGAVGSNPDNPPKVDTLLSGEIFWIEVPTQSKLVLECGTARAEGELQEPKFMRTGERSLYKINLEKPIAFDPVRKKSSNGVDPQSKTILGKIVLKDKGKIIAVGNIR